MNDVVKRLADYCAYNNKKASSMISIVEYAIRTYGILHDRRFWNNYLGSGQDEKLDNMSLYWGDFAQIMAGD